MPNETLQHLNTNTLIDFTEQRGHAWHYRAEEQGTEPNHYPGAIPIEDVRRRPSGWSAENRPVAVEPPAAPPITDPAADLRRRPLLHLTRPDVPVRGGRRSFGR